VVEANLVPLAAAQLCLDLIHSEADSRQVPVPATAVGDEDDTLKFWRGLMMSGWTDETSESSSKCISMVTELHSASRV
jgi:hypothetical protein